MNRDGPSEDNKGERLGEPYLTFPALSTPPGGNVISAGKSVYVPAQGDPIPYFTLQRSLPRRRDPGSLARLKSRERLGPVSYLSLKFNFQSKP